MKTDLFHSCGHCWVFQICCNIECSSFTAPSFRIWNDGIPAELFQSLKDGAVKLLHLNSHSRMSDYRWMITGSSLFESWRSFLCNSSVYSCQLFLQYLLLLQYLLAIPSASVMSIQFLSFIEPIFAWNVPLISLIFLKRSLVFPILLFSSNSLHWSLRKVFLFLLAILWNSAFRWVYLSLSPFPFTSLLSYL